MNEWTPVGALALLLVLRHSCWCYDTPVGASALLLVLRHSCWCYDIPIGASALLLMLRHSCCMGSHVDRCLGTSTGATAPRYCIVPSGTYCTASYSFLMIGLGSQTNI